MARSQTRKVLEHLRRAAFLREEARLSDGHLLGCFIERRDESAFAALVRRHGPMVWGVCRRVIRNHHDAEDAFQATFLVLVRKAASIVPREMLGNWLYGTASRTAWKARTMAARRRARESLGEILEPAVVEQDLWGDVQPLLDEELSHLPGKYRATLVLCDLEGKTRREAAQQLGVPEGTVAGRLARARRMLAKRLSQRGVVLSSAALAALLAQNAASGFVPVAAVSATIQAAALIAAGKGAAAASVTALTEGVLKAMLTSKLKLATAVLLAIGVLTAGVGTSRLFHGAQAGEQAAARQQRHARPNTAPGKQQKDDPVRDARTRTQVEEQRLTQLVQTNLRRARDRYAADPAAALKLVREALVQVWDNPDIGERVQDDLLRQLIDGRQQLTRQEKEEVNKGVWKLEFRFKNPRLVTVDVPGQGRKAIWYWPYEVSNPSTEPHTFLPDFELVTADKVYHDTVLPRALEAVRRVEDPTDALDLQNSVTIADRPIPPTKPGAERKAVAGVAMWEGVDADIKSFTIFVSGLSNAWTVAGDKVGRKTLQITFRRVDGEMCPVGPTKWLFRTAKPAAGDNRTDEQSEIERLIKQLSERVVGLEQELMIRNRKLEQLRVQIRVVEHEIEKVDQVAVEKDNPGRAKLVKRKADLEQELATCEEELTERGLARESQERRLETLERLLQRTKEKTPEDRPEEDRQKGLARNAVVQIRIANPAGMKVWVADGKGQFGKEPHFEVPGRFNLEPGHTYRLKITGIHGQPTVALYPTLEIPRAEDDRVRAFLSTNAIPLELTDEDLQRVATGTGMVTKVVYLLDAKKGADDSEVGDVGVILGHRLVGADAVEEAKRRGMILAVLRLGDIDLEPPDNAKEAIRTKATDQVKREAPVTTRTDGKILRLDQGGKRPYINLGSADGVRPQCTFTVHALSLDGKLLPVPKGTLEVTTVLGDHLSQTRITWVSDPDGNPIRAGDVLCIPPGR
jgi:RNA polymerase sigma factor (sigma-70 family)